MKLQPNPQISLGGRHDLPLADVHAVLGPLRPIGLFGLVGRLDPGPMAGARDGLGLLQRAGLCVALRAPATAGLVSPRHVARGGAGGAGGARLAAPRIFEDPRVP